MTNRILRNSLEVDLAESKWNYIDWCLLFTLLILCAMWILLKFQWNGTPVEDAAMLLRYSQNLANGHGIRYSINQGPVEGATDFLFMVSIAALSHLLHIGVVPASRTLNLVAEFCSVLLVFVGARNVLNGNRWLSAGAAAYLIAGPAIKMAEGCFGAPFFAAALLCSWCAALIYARGRAGFVGGMVFALLGLISGLIRPEGVLIAGIFLLATLLMTGWRRFVPMPISFAVVFVVLGGPYFAWRWHYFGYPLPNPFYVKGGGHLHVRSLRYAAVNLAVLLMPVLPLIPLGWLSTETRRLTTALVFVLSLFTLMWILLNNDNNHLTRFQYAIVPAVMLTVPGLVAGLWKHFRMPTGEGFSQPMRWAAIAAMVLAFAGAMGYIDREFQYTNDEFGMRIVAKKLAPFASKGYTMIVTEAGVLPLYSQWNAVDELGLNDAHIAHIGMSWDYLAQVKPEIIMYHATNSEGREALMEQLALAPLQNPDTGFGYLVSTYAKQNGYTLAAIWGDYPCNLHVYWVRPGFADHDAVVHIIRDTPYYFLDSGLPSHDYRNELPPSIACETPSRD